MKKEHLKKQTKKQRMKCREKKQERHQENKLASYFTQILHLFGAQHYDQEEVLQSSR